MAQTVFIPIPETTLPGGLVVPAFRIAQRPHSTSADGTPQVRINYHQAVSAAQDAGAQITRESQHLAVAYHIAAQDENWTGGKVGKGKLYQGFRNGNPYGAQPAGFEPKNPGERRWHILPGGHRIYDFAGHVFQWVFDDIQGDDRGLVARPFTADSPSLVIPYPADDKGQGWTPSAGADWSGRALIRGGCWYSERYAGAFYLNYDWPSRALDNVGFRCTLPGL